MSKKFEAIWESGRAEYFDEIRLELAKLRDEGVFQDRNIAMVGTWQNAYEINDIMTALGLKLTHIADNNPNKQNVSRLGIISQSVESLKNVEHLIILVISESNTKEIASQLVRLGFEKQKDFYVLSGGDRGGDNWTEIRKNVELGFQAYDEMQRKYNGLPIWLMHQPSLGDLYIFSLFLPYAMGVREIGECECVLIVTKNSVKKLAETIGYQNIELITYDEAMCNWLTMMRLMGDKLNVQPAVYHDLDNIVYHVEQYSTFNFRDSFTKYVFQFQKEVKPIYPMFPKRSQYVLELFEKHELIPGKTVLLSPYAAHTKATIEEKYWVHLVEALQMKGYTVCTNCGSKEEKPLPGTKAPFIEICDCVEFVETAGYFIGVRSGLCDLVCMANCSKTVIYETGDRASSISYFGFASMGIGENITEIENDCIHTQEMMNQIIEQF